MVAKSKNVMPWPIRVRSLLEPPPRLSVSHWCDRHRYLSRRFTAEAGPWRTARVPYLREPLDAFGDPEIDELTFIKCSRVGGTEWINNLMAYTADARPMPTMYAQPQESDIADELTGRLKAVFQDSERLRRHIPPGEWCNSRQINLNSMDIYGAWGTSPNTMIRKTCGLGIFDEIDNCAAQSNRLGNVLDLLAERLVTFGHRAKLVNNGTPTVESAPGWQKLKASDDRRPHVPCPFCGTWQVLLFQQLKLIASAKKCRDPDRIEADDLARYECEKCKAMIRHAEWHRWMIDRTVWIPRSQQPAEPLPLDDRDIVDRRSLAVPPHDPWTEAYARHQQWQPRLSGDPPRTRRRGYWINVLYSPWESRTWSRIMGQWFRAQGDPEKLRVFFNSWLAQPYADAVEVTDIQVLGSRREGAHEEGHVPIEAKILTMGADVHSDNRPDAIYWVIRAWGAYDTSWLIRHGTCSTFDQLYRMAFYTGYPIVGRKQMMRCYALAIDSRFRQDEVYEFGRRSGVTLVKGEQAAAYKWKPFAVDKLPNGKPKAGSRIVYHVNTSYFKTKVHRLARLSGGQPGYWSLHRDTSDEYLQHFTAEHQVRMKVGTRRTARYELIWKPKTEGAPNHWLDAEVYSAALADIIDVPLIHEDASPVGLMVAKPKAFKPSKKHGEGSQGSGGPDDFGGYLG